MNSIVSPHTLHDYALQILQSGEQDLFLGAEARARLEAARTLLHCSAVRVWPERLALASVGTPQLLSVCNDRSPHGCIRGLLGSCGNSRLWRVYRSSVRGGIAVVLWVSCTFRRAYMARPNPSLQRRCASYPGWSAELKR